MANVNALPPRMFRLQQVGWSCTPQNPVVMLWRPKHTRAHRHMVNMNTLPPRMFRLQQVGLSCTPQNPGVMLWQPKHTRAHRHMVNMNTLPPRMFRLQQCYYYSHYVISLFALVSLTCVRPACFRPACFRPCVGGIFIENPTVRRSSTTRSRAQGLGLRGGLLTARRGRGGRDSGRRRDRG